MPHPDDPTTRWSSGESVVSAANLSRRERNRLSSIQARKKAKLEQHQIELSITGYQNENRLLRSLVEDTIPAPAALDENLIVELRHVGHGVQSALDSMPNQLDQALTTAARTLTALANGHPGRDSLVDIKAARERMQAALVLDQIRAVVKEDVQAQFLLWGHKATSTRSDNAPPSGKCACI